jgi:hypothetical protein
MNEQIHPNLFVFDRARTADGLLFATGGDRCRYLGKSSREKPDWLKQNEGRYRRIEDVLREDAPRMPSVEAEINLGAGPVEPADSSSSPEVRNDGDDKDDVALADALLGDCSRPCEPTSLPTPVKENAKKQKPPAGISKSTPKLSPKIMRIILNSLRECPILYHAAMQAGIHRKTLEYWIRIAARLATMVTTSSGKALRGDFTNTANQRSGRHISNSRTTCSKGHFLGYDKVLTRRGRVMYKIDQGLVGLGFQGPDAYLRDENGNPVPETVRKVDTKAQLSVLKRHRPNTWGKHPKIDAPREGGVLVIGDVTKKPKYNTASKRRGQEVEGGFEKDSGGKRLVSSSARPPPPPANSSKRTTAGPTTRSATIHRTAANG